jgi:FtsZ-binding cell division protein ZapB
MSNTEIIPGMTEVMDYIKKQEEEIKDLNNRLMTCKMSIAIRDTEINELKEENEFLDTYEKQKALSDKKELEEENNKLHKTINTMACSSATTDLCMECWIIHEQIDPKLLLGNWKEFYVKDENGKWIKKPKKNILSERKKQKKKKKKKEFDYGESDDWVWGYGFQEKSSEYVINISGGGDGVSPNGFEDWVIKKVGGELKYYIRHGGNIPDKEQKEDGVPMELWSCPEGNYVSFQQSNYKPREGEASFDWLEDALEEEEDEDDT